MLDADGQPGFPVAHGRALSLSERGRRGCLLWVPMTFLPCPGNRICCPNPDCGKPVEGADLCTGSGFFHCNHKIGAFESRRRCNQHFFVQCTDRLCSVWAVSRALYDRFSWRQYTDEDVLRAIGEELRGEVAREAA